MSAETPAAEEAVESVADSVWHSPAQSVERSCYQSQSVRRRS